MADAADNDKARGAIAEAFVNARLAAHPLEAYPGAAPSDLAEAYKVQDLAMRLHGGVVGGWKVGRIGAPFDERHGANRLAGPIFADSIVDGLATPPPAMPVFVGGFAAAEAELLLRVGPNAAQIGIPENLEDARQMVDEVRLGIEIASSPFAGINAMGPAVTVSDFGNNNGMVLGPVIADWRDRDLTDIPARLLIDGAEAGCATMATMLDGPFGSVRFLAANLAGRGIALRPGTWVSTGAITGVHQARPGQDVTVRFGADHEVSCRITAATGR